MSRKPRVASGTRGSSAQAPARQPSAIDVAQTVVPGEGRAFTIDRVMGVDLGDPVVSAREAARIAAQPSPMRDMLRSERDGFFDVLA